MSKNDKLHARIEIMQKLAKATESVGAGNVLGSIGYTLLALVQMDKIEQGEFLPALKRMMDFANDDSATRDELIEKAAGMMTAHDKVEKEESE